MRFIVLYCFNGTPKLSWIFGLSEPNQTQESLMAEYSWISSNPFWPEIREIGLKKNEVNRNSELDNFEFFFGGVRITKILTNFSLGGKLFEKRKPPEVFRRSGW